MYHVLNQGLLFSVKFVVLRQSCYLNHFLLNRGFFANIKNTMAKRQKTMRDMFLRNVGHVDVSNESLTNTSNTKKGLNQVEAARLS